MWCGRHSSTSGSNDRILDVVVGMAIVVMLIVVRLTALAGVAMAIFVMIVSVVLWIIVTVVVARVAAVVKTEAASGTKQTNDINLLQ